jgi:hypothetical protein
MPVPRAAASCPRRTSAGPGQARPQRLHGGRIHRLRGRAAGVQHLLGLLGAGLDHDRAHGVVARAQGVLQVARHGGELLRELHALLGAAGGDHHRQVLRHGAQRSADLPEEALLLVGLERVPVDGFLPRVDQVAEHPVLRSGLLLARDGAVQLVPRHAGGSHQQARDLGGLGASLAPHAASGLAEADLARLHSTRAG